MIELYKQSLISQFDAALSMLNACVSQCPDEDWESNVGDFPFWQVAYHTLFYTDLYLSPNEDSFVPPSFHHENYQFFGRLPWPPHETVLADNPYDKAKILEYLQHCRRKAPQALIDETTESLQGSCGFWWYKTRRAEFHMNNVRHIQHHTAQLSLHLRKSHSIDIGWIGSGFKDSTGSS